MVWKDEMTARDVGGRGEAEVEGEGGRVCVGRDRTSSRGSGRDDKGVPDFEWGGWREEM